MEHFDLTVSYEQQLDTPARARIRDQVNASGRRLVAVDVETTRLAAAPGSITEVGWFDIGAAVGGRFVPPHLLDDADPTALDIGGYYRRGLDREPPDPAAVPALHRLLTGATLIGANPAFDADHLDALFTWTGIQPVRPWNYRVVDVSAAAHWLNPNTEPGVTPGLAAAAEFFGVEQVGHHEALDDALTAARCWFAAETRRVSAPAARTGGGGDVAGR